MDFNSYSVFEKLLKLRGVSSATVAANTGVSQTTLSQWKSGRSTPKADKLQKIADYFGVSLEYLMTGKVSYSYIEDESPGYYVNEEVAKYAQEVFDKPEMKALFDASKNLSPDTIKQFAELMKKYGGDNNDD